MGAKLLAIFLAVALTAAAVAAAGSRGRVSFGVEHAVARTVSGHQLVPRTGRGGYLAVYRSQTATTGERLRVRRLRSDGRPAGPARVVAGSAPSNRGLVASNVAYDEARDRFLVLYSRIDRVGDRDVQGKLYRQLIAPSGAPLGKPRVVGAAPAEGRRRLHDRLEYDSRRRGFVLLFTDYEVAGPYDATVRYTRALTAGGAPAGRRHRVSPSVSFCRLARNRRRAEFLVACVVDTGARSGVLTRRIGSRAQPIGRPVLVKARAAARLSVAANARTGRYALAIGDGQKLRIQPVDGRGRPRGRGVSFLPPEGYDGTVYGALDYDPRSNTFLATWAAEEDRYPVVYRLSWQAQLLGPSGARPLGHRMRLPAEPEDGPGSGSVTAADGRGGGYLLQRQGEREDGAPALLTQRMYVR